MLLKFVLTIITVGVNAIDLNWCLGEKDDVSDFINRT